MHWDNCCEGRVLSALRKNGGVEGWARHLVIKEDLSNIEA